MAKKNITVLSFNYNTWACCVGKITKSAAKMKKIVKDDIKRCLIWGNKKNGEYVSTLTLTMPFFPLLSVNSDTKVTVDFGDDCKFKCEELSYIHETEDEKAEVQVDGTIKVTVEWKY